MRLCVFIGKDACKERLAIEFAHRLQSKNVETRLLSDSPLISLSHHQRHGIRTCDKSSE
jgi:hypothetical protein